MSLAIGAGRVVPIAVMGGGNPSAFKDDGTLEVPLGGEVFLPLLVVACHAKGVVPETVSVCNGLLQKLCGNGGDCAPAVLGGLSQKTVVIDYERHLGEGAGIEGTDPLHNLGILGGVLVNEAMALSPLAKSVCVYEVNFVDVVVFPGHGFDEAGVFFLENGVVRVGGANLTGAHLGGEVLGSGVKHIIRGVLSLVPAVHHNAEGKLHAPVQDRLEKAVDTGVRVLPGIFALFRLK